MASDEYDDNLSEADSEMEKKLIEMYKKKLAKEIAYQKFNDDFELVDKII